MKDKIKIGIVGYGNLGKGVELAIDQNDDMELTAIFTRRQIDSIITNSYARVLDVNNAVDYKGSIDVIILCGGSKTDIPIQGPYFAKMFNTVDGYDNHKNAAEYIKAMEDASKTKGKTCAPCVGWDPGLFSLNRVMLEAIMPQGTTYTFWGPGVSQGHSDAVRKLPGVKMAIQYTIPNEESIKKIKNNETPALTNREMHGRVCYVALEVNADRKKIINDIKNMPNYFKDYDTEVTFVSEEEIIKNHSKLFHGGFIIRNGATGKDSNNKHRAEFSLKLDSNSEFTASVLVAYARAVHRLNKEGIIGAKTILDIPLSYLSRRDKEDIYKNLI